MSTSLPFPYVHTVRYFSKGMDAAGAYYKVEYLIDAYANSDAMVNALLGQRTATGLVITSFSPHQHPLSPNLYCKSADVIDGLGGPALNSLGYPGYNGGALIRCEYRPLMFDVVSQPQNSFDQSGTEPVLWATQELDFGSETYTINRATYTYTSGPAGVSGKPSQVPVKIRIPLTTMILTYERTPYLIMTLVRSLRFRVNTSTFLGAAAGLVLFEGPRTNRQFNSDGSACQETQLIFQERDANYPWNSLPNTIDMSWNPVADGTNGMFQTADLTPLAACNAPNPAERFKDGDASSPGTSTSFSASFVDG